MTRSIELNIPRSGYHQLGPGAYPLLFYRELASQTCLSPEQSVVVAVLLITLEFTIDIFIQNMHTFNNLKLCT